MEFGKGYAFVGRQYHIHTDNDDYYVDLVFYNYILKCFILVDLKVGKITHQDVGQMDMYVRMFDELIKDKSDNPTLGIVLCSQTNEDIAKYSILKGNEHLFATKYKLYLPNEIDLKAEIERLKNNQENIYDYLIEKYKTIKKEINIVIKDKFESTVFINEQPKKTKKSTSEAAASPVKSSSKTTKKSTKTKTKAKK